jgi:flagellar basal body-associated protein FliL
MFKKIAIIITLILLVVVAIVLYRTFNFNSKQLQADKSAIDISINKDAIYRLADAIKLNTVSYE